ncbi:MAG: hypothetical protein ACPGLV_10810, partial [Bacteroidia bacterium]
QPTELLTVGQIYNAELRFYPGVGNQRAIFKNKQAIEVSPKLIPEIETIDTLYNHLVELKSVNPLIENTCILIGNVKIAIDNSKTHLVDQNLNAIEIYNNETQIWQLLAVSGGQPFNAFLLKQSNQYFVESISINQQLFCL